MEKKKLSKKVRNEKPMTRVQTVNNTVYKTRTHGRISAHHMLLYYHYVTLQCRMRSQTMRTMTG